MTSTIRLQEESYRTGSDGGSRQGMYLTRCLVSEGVIDYAGLLKCVSRHLGRLDAWCSSSSAAPTPAPKVGPEDEPQDERVPFDTEELELLYRRAWRDGCEARTEVFFEWFFDARATRGRSVCEIEVDLRELQRWETTR
jgi:hypothetical protein